MKKMYNTPRLVLKKFTDLDLNDLYIVLSDNKIIDNKLDGNTDFKKAVETLQLFKNSDNYFAIELKKDVRVIGIFYVNELNNKDVEVGYLLNDNYKNKGYAAEALNEVSDEYLNIKDANLLCVLGEKKYQTFKMLGSSTFIPFTELKKVVPFFKD